MDNRISQMLIFVRSIDGSFIFRDDLLKCIGLKGTTKRLSAVETAKIFAVCTDDASAIKRKIIGFVGQKKSKIKLHFMLSLCNSSRMSVC